MGLMSSTISSVTRVPPGEELSQVYVLPALDSSPCHLGNRDILAGPRERIPNVGNILLAICG